MSTSSESLIGNLVEGRYLIESELGVGGIGAVYLARDMKVLGRGVVVKVLLEESFKNEYVVKKFRQEAEALSRLDHPNVVSILDYGEMEGGQPYLVLQYIDGISLRPVIQPGGVPPERVAHIFRQVTLALCAAHEKNILHRDLKPENIMLQQLGGEERVIVIDFGIAQIQDSVIAPKTVVGATAGTISYMSPEQLRAEMLTPASDVYALGTIAYELLTGQKPYNPNSPYQLLELQREGSFLPLRALRPDVPEAAEAVIRRALAYRAGERYQTAREFGVELFRALTGGASSGATAALQGGLAAPAAGPSAATSHGPQGYAAGTVPRQPPGATGVENAPTVAFPEAGAGTNQPHPAQATANGPAYVTAEATPAPPPQRRSKLPLLALVGLFAVAALGGGAFAVWKFTRPSAPAATGQPRGAAPQQPANVNQGAAPAGGGAQPAAGELVLNYSLTVQRVRDGKEYQQPFESTGREAFENGWRFRTNVSSPQPGYLYLVNEGLNEGGAQTYTLLFPTHGDARLAAGERAQIPEPPQYYFFTGTAGTEKIWMIWSPAPVPEMEPLKELINPQDQGEVKDPARAAALREFLSKHAATKPEVAEDRVNRRTTLRAPGPLLVHLAEPEHY